MGANNLAGALEDYIRKQGGVSGLVKKFEAQGLGAVARSWTAAGTNNPISAAQLQRVIGHDTVVDLAKKSGLSPDATAAKLADSSSGSRGQSDGEDGLVVFAVRLISLDGNEEAVTPRQKCFGLRRRLDRNGAPPATRKRA